MGGVQALMLLTRKCQETVQMLCHMIDNGGHLC